jgi:hypothetical protein
MNEGVTMQQYDFPSTNPQKVTFAFKELGLDCELVLVDLSKGEHRQPAFLAHNPFGRVPVLVDDGLTPALVELHQNAKRSPCHRRLFYGRPTLYWLAARRRNSRSIALTRAR